MLYDLRFRPGATHLLAGPSGSGKTFTIKEILQNKNEIFHNGHQIKNVVVFYASWQSIYTDLQANQLVSRWINKMPTNDEYVQIVEPYKNAGGSIVIIDDFMSEIGKDLVDIVTVSARHNNASTFILLQSLFPIARMARQISLNVKYMYIFKNPRENAQFSHLIRQVLPQDNRWMQQAYAEATKNPYSYVMLDMTQECPDKIRFRSSILPSQWPLTVWVKKGDQ